MKGKFTLYRIDDELRIGNLGKGSDEPVLFTIAVPNSRHNLELASNIIAHAVVEHKKSHIKSRSVTVEDEIQALGASYFIRGTSDLYSVVDQLAYVFERYLEPIPKNWVIRSNKHKEDCWPCFMEDIKAAAIDRFEPEDIDETKLIQAMAHFWYGYALKSSQFNDDNNKALDTFNFIKDCIGDVLRYSPIEEYQKLVVVYNTDTYLFKYTHLYFHGENQ